MGAGLAVLVASAVTAVLVNRGPTPSDASLVAGTLTASRTNFEAPGASASAAADTTGTPTPAASTPATTTRPPASRTTAPPAGPGPIGSSSKKGVSTWNIAGAETALSAVNASWYYNWAAGPTNGAGGRAEFVPMIWGRGSVTAGNLAKAKSSGSVLLGFNEPDFAEQSNLTVEAALDLWPQVQATGLRLGSPAPAVGGATPGGWLDRFMTGARERGYRVDFIALHWYGSDFSDAAVGHLEGLPAGRARPVRPADLAHRVRADQVRFRRRHVPHGGPADPRSSPG